MINSNPAPILQKCGQTNKYTAHIFSQSWDPEHHMASASIGGFSSFPSHCRVVMSSATQLRSPSRPRFRCCRSSRARLVSFDTATTESPVRLRWSMSWEGSLPIHQRTCRTPWRQWCDSNCPFRGHSYVGQQKCTPLLLPQYARVLEAWHWFWKRRDSPTPSSVGTLFNKRKSSCRPRMSKVC